MKTEARELRASKVEVFVEDVTAEGPGARAVNRVVELLCGLEAPVHNAGWSDAEFIAKDTDRSRWQKTVEINHFTAIGITQTAKGLTWEAGSGSIVFISSDAAFGEIRQGIYGMTKAGVIALAKTVAKEHYRHGIHSNVVFNKVRLNRSRWRFPCAVSPRRTPLPTPSCG